MASILRVESVHGARGEHDRATSASESLGLREYWLARAVVLQECGNLELARAALGHAEEIGSPDFFVHQVRQALGMD